VWLLDIGFIRNSGMGYQIENKKYIRMGNSKRAGFVKRQHRPSIVDGNMPYRLLGTGIFDDTLQ
jgi:hypothetical protein